LTANQSIYLQQRRRLGNKKQSEKSNGPFPRGRASDQARSLKRYGVVFEYFCRKRYEEPHSWKVDTEQVMMMIKESGS